MRTRIGAGPASRRWLAVAATAAAAMVFAGTAGAATLAQAACSEPVPGTFNITLSGSGFVPNAIVTITWTAASGLPLPVLTTTVPADGSGSFGNVVTVVMDTPGSPGSAFPVGYTAVDPAGNSASLTVTSCGGGGGGGGGGGAQPEAKTDCKQDGHLAFTDPSFKNQGRCVSAVASKSK